MNVSSVSQLPPTAERQYLIAKIAALTTVRKDCAGYRLRLAEIEARLENEQPTLNLKIAIAPTTPPPSRDRFADESASSQLRAPDA